MALSRARSVSAAEEQLDAELVAHQLSAGDFVDPDLQSPLDVEARLSQTPTSSTTKGMFLEQLGRAARTSGVPCEARYVPFREYPLQDFMRLLNDCARARFPKLPVREAFRRVGWDAFPTLMNSVAGKVIFSFARADAHGVLRLAPQGYKQSLSHCTVALRVSSPGQVVLEYRDVWNFPECYHVGVVEGACRAFGSEARVRVRVLSPCNVDMLVRW